MNIALIGYGKMGKMIENVALSRNHNIVCIIDKDNITDFDSSEFKLADVAIEFTQPESALNNMYKCFERNMPIVCGTTGWNKLLPEVTEECNRHNGALFYASNYSIGVNVMFHINKYMASIMNKLNGYDVQIQEIHHIHKLDSPSGTAITLAEGLIENLQAKTEWVNNVETPEKHQLQILSERRGEVPGYHKVSYKSETDTLELVHDAHGRFGFASGAVFAAEFIYQKKGVYTMSHMLQL